MDPKLNGKTGLPHQDASADVKRICIIGGGPTGLGALKIIKESPQYKQGLVEAIAFEAREAIGGIWLPALPTGNPPLTPLYDSLTTNTATPLMAYPDFPFPPSTSLYPPASVVLAYLQSYAAHYDLNRHIRLRTTIRLIDWDASISKWHVHWSPTDSEPDGPTEEGLFDLVAVANGHYRFPHYPETPGLRAWLDAGKASHAAWYRHPYDLGNTILVVGGGPSGIDIADEMRSVSLTVVHSIPGAEREDLEGGAVKRRSAIVEFLDPHEGRVLFEDGTTEAGIDHCILATGYEHHLPFLPPSLVENSLPPAFPPIPAKLYNSKHHLFPVAKQIFPLVTSFPPSRFAFLVLPYRVIPFRFIEVQMRAVLKVFFEPGHLDPAQETADLVARREELRAEVGDSAAAIARAWHKYPPENNKQFDYLDDLYRFVGGEYARDAWKVPAWVREFWAVNPTLRDEWRALERDGEAEKWAAGVGEAGGEAGWQQWADLMRRVYHHAQERKAKSGEQTGATQQDQEPVKL